MFLLSELTSYEQQHKLSEGLTPIIPLWIGELAELWLLWRWALKIQLSCHDVLKESFTCALLYWLGYSVSRHTHAALWVATGETIIIQLAAKLFIQKGISKYLIVEWLPLVGAGTKTCGVFNIVRDMLCICMRWVRIVMISSTNNWTQLLEKNSWAHNYHNDIGWILDSI